MERRSSIDDLKCKRYRFLNTDDIKSNEIATFSQLYIHTACISSCTAVFLHAQRVLSCTKVGPTQARGHFLSGLTGASTWGRAPCSSKRLPGGTGSSCSTGPSGWTPRTWSCSSGPSTSQVVTGDGCPSRKLALSGPPRLDVFQFGLWFFFGWKKSLLKSWQFVGKTFHLLPVVKTYLEKPIYNAGLPYILHFTNMSDN